MLSARTREGVADAREELRQLLLERHRISPGDVPDFGIQSIGGNRQRIGYHHRGR